MTFDTIIDGTIQILRRRGRVTYRTLRREFGLDDGGLDDLKHEMITGLRLAVDDGGETLVWAGGEEEPAGDLVTSAEQGPPSASSPAAPETAPESLRAQRAREVEQLASEAPTFSATLLSAFSSSTPSQPRGEGTSGVRPSARLTADDRLERRQVSVLFCSLTGLAALTERLAHDEIRALVRSFQGACAEQVLRHEGHVAQHLGDGVLAYFGWTLAQPEVAERAVRAGLACVAAASRLGSAATEKLGLRLAARAAVHTDSVAMSEQRGSGSQHLALSEARAVAAGVEASGPPGAVVVTEATSQRLGRRFELRDRGETALEGGRQARLFEVLREQSEAHAAPRLMVGREAELAEFEAMLDRARGGQGGVLLLSGAAGIGKSRMVEAARALAGEGMKCLSFRCSAVQVDTALHPFVESAERTFGLSRELTADRKLAALRAALEATSLPVSRALPLFATLFSLDLSDHEPLSGGDKQRQKEETLALITSWLAEQTREQPVLAVWEDVHWADPSTIELFWLLVKQAEGLPILHLMTSRPEFSAPFRRSAGVREISLARFGTTQVDAIVKGMIGEHRASPELVALIAEKTGGVPLFVEEVIRTLLASGDLGSRGAGLAAGATLAVPGTLQESLLPRLERMGSARDLAQLGATIGREFSVELLATLTGLPVAAIRHDLDQLLEAELLLTDTRGERHAFKHALIQDVVYHSQEHAVRQSNHARIARALEELFPLIALRQPEFVAHHFAAAGLHEAAIVYHKKAGERALAQSAYVEAEAHFRRAVEATSHLPESVGRDGLELDLRILSGMPLTATLGYGAPEVQANYGRARVLALKLGRSTKLFPALYGMWRSCLLHADYLAGLELGESLVVMCETSRPSFQIAARRCVGAILFYMGQYGASAEHMRAILSASVSPEEVRNESVSYEVVDAHVTAHSYLGWSRWMLGDPIGACAQSDLAVETSLSLGSGFTLALACSFASWLHQFRRDVGATRHRVSQGLAISMEKGLEMWVGWCKVLLGWTYMEEGRISLSSETMRAGMDTWQRTGSVLGMSYFSTMLAEAEGRAGRLEVALDCIAEAERFAARTKEHFYASETLRTKGELLHLAGAGRGPVEQALRAAHDEAIAASTPTFALRAATSLVRCVGDDAVPLLEASLGAVARHRERDVVEAQRLLAARGVVVPVWPQTPSPMRSSG
jgi:class 3 adenylate cyclase/predicted ATPase